MRNFNIFLGELEISEGEPAASDAEPPSTIRSCDGTARLQHVFTSSKEKVL